MTTIERLKLGRERIARGWTQGSYCRDAVGDAAHVGSSSAVAWCALGALCGGGNDAEARDALRLTVGMHVPTWNDAPGRTQAEVLRAFDETIARLEAAGAT